MSANKFTHEFKGDAVAQVVDLGNSVPSGDGYSIKANSRWTIQVRS
jgi:hypothetical protein